MDQARVLNALTNGGAITAELQTEHQAIRDSLQALRDALLAGATPETAAETLDTVLDFCVAHFRSDEQAFRDHGYADADAHAGAYEILLGRLRAARSLSS
jgi:hemerythrin